jgi:hypothetical protein
LGLRAREPIAAGKPVSMMVMGMSEVLSHFINPYINDSIPRGKSQGEFWGMPIIHDFLQMKII